MATADRPRARAAAWAADGTLAVLVARGRKTSIVKIDGGRVIAELPAVAAATRIAVLDDGAVLTLANTGTGKLARDGAVRNASIKRTIKDLAVCHGVAHAVGPARGLWRLDAATGGWASMGLAEALRRLAPAAVGESSAAHSIVEGRRGPIVGVHAGTLRETLVVEWTGEAWQLRGRCPRVHALAVSPDDVVYAIGDEIHALDARGRVKRISAADPALWSGGWVTDDGGSLLVATLASVHRVGPRGRLRELLARADGEVPHNHSLFTRGPHAAFVRAGAVHVLSGGRFVALALA